MNGDNVQLKNNPPDTKPRLARPDAGISADTTHPAAQARALRSIALFEAIKGIAAIAASIGLLSLVHHDVRHIAMQLISHLGMSPTAHYPTILLHDADLLQDTNLRSLLLLAIAYTSLRLVEAYGLWHEFEWAEWMGALSGAIYIPFEIRHILYRPHLAGVLVFLVNLAVVGFLGFQLWRRRAKR
ncbi:uncharacterized membrane protein (DUF2068 family) [Oxalobacteraceae bacterium GrIS 2.11]